jgi:threonine synthase
LAQEEVQRFQLRGAPKVTQVVARGALASRTPSLICTALADAARRHIRPELYCPMPSVLDLIGDTPLVEVTQLDTLPCRLFLKLESANPSGSIKDRPARAMIEAAEADGRLKPSGTIVEATAGNTGLGLALVGGRKGYRTVLVVPDKMAREKILHARAMGAEVVLTRSDVGKGHPDYYQDLAETIAGRTRGESTSTSSPIRPIRVRMRQRPGRS